MKKSISAQLKSIGLKPVSVNIWREKVLEVIANANKPSPMAYYLKEARRCQDKGNSDAATDRKVEKVPGAAQEVSCGSVTILLVEDKAVALYVVSEFLKRLGYTVLEAKGSREVVEIYEANRDDIHLVILDMVMPTMGGGEAYDRLKEIDPDIKVLLSSGFSIDGEATEILERGCDGFIQKPFKMNELAKKIREVLEKE